MICKNVSLKPYQTPWGKLLKFNEEIEVPLKFSQDPDILQAVEDGKLRITGDLPPAPEPVKAVPEQPTKKAAPKANRPSINDNKMKEELKELTARVDNLEEVIQSLNKTIKAELSALKNQTEIQILQKEIAGLKTSLATVGKSKGLNVSGPSGADLKVTVLN